jgi:hypothetical protein
MNAKEKYIQYISHPHRAFSSRWVMIHLSNLADAIKLEDIPKFIDEVQQIAVQRREQRVQKLSDLSAPPSIMNHEIAQLEKTKQGKSPEVRSLARSFNRRKEEGSLKL